SRKLLDTEYAAPRAAAEAELNAALREREEIGARIQERAEENNKLAGEMTRLAGTVNDRINKGADVTLQFSDNISSANDELKETKKLSNEITLSPLEQSIKNSLSDLSRLQSE